MQNEEEIWRLVDGHAAPMIALADRIWGMPELCYNEHRSCAEHTQALHEAGFRVTGEVAGIPTAVMGEAGEGGPVIAILGEYDALPGLSQEADVAEPRPLPGDGTGHGCGHNLLGSAAMLAAISVKEYLAANGLPGRVRYYGCPAEEGGAAKGFMVREGAFDDVDIAISWHPSAFLWGDGAGVAGQYTDRFHLHRPIIACGGGAASRALGARCGGADECGRELHARTHAHPMRGCITPISTPAGVAPNVVQGRAVVRYLIRARDVVELNRLVVRVRKIADGAALMTETSVSTQVISAVSNLMGNKPLEAAMQANLDRLGPPPFDDADREIAKTFQATLSAEDISASWRRAGVPECDVSLCDAVIPVDAKPEKMIGSTDVGDVSWKVPTVQARGATYAIGTPGHSWQLTAQGKNAASHKGLVHVAKVMAGTAVDALLRPEVIAAAKAEHAARMAKTPYVSPLPEGARPALGMSL